MCVCHVPPSYIHNMVAEPRFLLHGKSRSRDCVTEQVRIRLVVWWSGELRVESVERGAPGNGGVKPVKRVAAVWLGSSVENFCGYEKVELGG